MSDDPVPSLAALQWSVETAAHELMDAREVHRLAGQRLRRANRAYQAAVDALTEFQRQVKRNTENHPFFQDE